MTKTAHDSPLGRQVAGSAHYDAGLLFPIARAGKRAELGIGTSLPFHGVDALEVAPPAPRLRRVTPQGATLVDWQSQIDGVLG